MECGTSQLAPSDTQAQAVTAHTGVQAPVATQADPLQPCRQALDLNLTTGHFCLFVSLLLAVSRGMRDLSSPTRDRTHVRCIGSAES